MGDPVRIYDLACNLVRLSGLRLGRDIEVKVTGLRPGEKLYEELLMDDENIVRTGLDKIFITKPDVITWEAVESMLQTLQTCVAENGDMRACLHSLLPSFQPPEVVNSRVAPQTVDSAEASEL